MSHQLKLDSGGTREMNKKYMVVNEHYSLKENLTIEEAEYWLCYYLNHDEDAYIMGQEAI